MLYLRKNGQSKIGNENQTSINTNLSLEKTFSTELGDLNKSGRPNHINYQSTNILVDSELPVDATVSRSSPNFCNTNVSFDLNSHSLTNLEPAPTLETNITTSSVDERCVLSLPQKALRSKQLKIVSNFLKQIGKFFF